MDERLDSLSVSQMTRVRIPLNVHVFIFLSLAMHHILHLQFIGWTDICAAELALTHSTLRAYI